MPVLNVNTGASALAVAVAAATVSDAMMAGVFMVCLGDNGALLRLPPRVQEQPHVCSVHLPIVIQVSGERR